MNLIQFDNVIKNPEQYLEEVIKYEFVDEQTGEKAFGDIQQRNEKDEFSDFVLSMFLGYEITLNFILNNALGAHGTFLVYAGICFLGFLFILKKLPETKGKTLEEVEELLTKKKIL